METLNFTRLHAQNVSEHLQAGSLKGGMFQVELGLVFGREFTFIGLKKLEVSPPPSASFLKTWTMQIMSMFCNLHVCINKFGWCWFTWLCHGSMHVSIFKLHINTLKFSLFMDNPFLIRFLLTSGKQTAHCGKYNNCDGRMFGGRIAQRKNGAQEVNFKGRNLCKLALE